MDKIKLYDVSIDSDVFAISLVDYPAIEEDFVYLSKEKPQQICLEKDEKHLVVGPVLIPNKPIYRNNGREEYFIQFSKETIEQLAYNYLKNGFQSSVTEQHMKDVEDITVVESWLKTSENDKSNDYNMNLPIGTWMCAMKVDNEELWGKIKSGEVRGFSVEAFVNLDEIKLQKKDNMTEEVKMEQIEVNDGFWSKLKSIIADALSVPATSEEEAAEVAEEVVEEVKDEAEVKEDEVKEEEVEMNSDVTEETEVETPVEEVELKSDEVEVNPNEELENTIAQLRADLASKDEAIEKMTKEIEKLSKQPSAEPVKVEASKQNGEHPSFLDFASGRIKI